MPLPLTTVTADGSALRIRYGPGLMGALEHWHFNTFRAKWKAEWRGAPLVTFIIGPSGRVEALEMTGARFVRRRPSS